MTEHHSSLNRRTVRFNSREALAINYGAIELEWKEHKAADISCLGLEIFPVWVLKHFTMCVFTFY